MAINQTLTRIAISSDDVPSLSIPHDYKMIHWLDNHYENYHVIDQMYEETEFVPGFVLFLDNGYTIDQLKAKGQPTGLYGFQDRSKPLTQKINDLKGDLDHLSAYATQEVANAQAMTQDYLNYKASINKGSEGSGGVKND